MDDERIAHGGEGATPAGMVFSLVCGFALATGWAVDHKDDLTRVWGAVADSYQVGAAYSVSASVIVPYKRKPDNGSQSSTRASAVPPKAPERH